MDTNQIDEIIANLENLKNKRSLEETIEIFEMKLGELKKRLKKSRSTNILIFGFNRVESFYTDQQIVEILFNCIEINLNYIKTIERSSDFGSVAPILVKLKHKSHVYKILNAAKKLKHFKFSKNFSIAPDLLLRERMLNKYLVTRRKELNKELRESVPDANFYFDIKNKKIVKIYKDNDASESQECLEKIYALINKNLNDLNISAENNKEILRSICGFILELN